MGNDPLAQLEMEEADRIAEAQAGLPHHVRPEQVRGTTHGDFFTMSATVQAIKDTMHMSHNWPTLHSSQKEALELIATKIGRILTGDPGHLDHWQDGAGYFNKGAEVCAAYNKDGSKPNA